MQDVYKRQQYDGRMEESEDGLRGASVALLNADGTETVSYTHLYLCTGDVRPEKRRNNQPARGRRSLW